MKATMRIIGIVLAVAFGVGLIALTAAYPVQVVSYAIIAAVVLSPVWLIVSIMRHARYAKNHPEETAAKRAEWEKEEAREEAFNATPLGQALEESGASERLRVALMCAAATSSS